MKQEGNKDVHHNRTNRETNAITSKSVHLLETVVVLRHTIMAMSAYAKVSEGTYLARKRKLTNGLLVSDMLITGSKSSKKFHVSIINPLDTPVKLTAGTMLTSVENADVQACYTICEDIDAEIVFQL